MSDSSVALAQSIAASQAASTRQAIQTEVVKQQAEQDQALVTLLEQSAQQQKAALPVGQGASLDIFA